eukprot:5103348-Amphidinium_carterae.1
MTLELTDGRKPSLKVSFYPLSRCVVFRHEIRDWSDADWAFSSSASQTRSAQMLRKPKWRACGVKQSKLWHTQRLHR